MTTETPTEVWQARIRRDFAEQLHADASVLGLQGRTDIVRTALQMFHRRALEERMAQSVDAFYGDTAPPLPIGALPADDEPETGPSDPSGPPPVL